MPKKYDYLWHGGPEWEKWNAERQVKRAAKKKKRIERLKKRKGKAASPVKRIKPVLEEKIK